MKIFNPKTDLFKWAPLEGKLVYVQPFIMTAFFNMPDKYDWICPPTLILFDHSTLVWINERSGIDSYGAEYLKKYFLDLENNKNLWEEWDNWIKEFNESTEELENLDFKELTDEQLYERLASFYNLNISFWLIALVSEFSNIGGEGYFRKKLEKLFGDKANQHLEVLLTPTKLSFLQQEELDLLKLASHQDRTEALKEHSEKYHWLLNSYIGNRVLDVNYFKEKLEELLKQKPAEQHIKEIQDTVEKNKQRKENLIKELKLSEELILMAHQMSQSIWWQDLRKSYILQLSSFWDKFLEEIDRRTDWSFEELHWCWYNELLDIVKGEKVDKASILKRQNYYAIYAENGSFEKITDENFIKSSINSYLKADVSNVKELKGLVVSRGEPVQGVVKIIKNPFTDADKMQQGDILVATVTEPEFVVLMRKAAAIVTDQGGMTSHAAIISRELGIPCIVGTKIATQALQDGDIVTVDANKGIVKIIE